MDSVYGPIGRWVNRACHEHVVFTTAEKESETDEKTGRVLVG